MDELRRQLKSILSWRDAHADFDRAVAALPAALRSVAPAGLPYSPWQLIEHIRLTQADILAFCSKPDYHEPTWPKDYWPVSAGPPTELAWDDSIRKFHDDRRALEAMIEDPHLDLFATVPAGTGQTFLREFLVVADHSAYHVGELVVVRRLLGAWPPAQEAPEAGGAVAAT